MPSDTVSPSQSPGELCQGATPSSSPWARGHRSRTGLAFLLALLALYGGSLPNDTRSAWFRELIRPEVLPRELERLIPWIWLSLFLLGGLALAAVSAAPRHLRWKWQMAALFLLQLALNYSYSYTFTMLRDIGTAFWLAVALAIVTFMLVVSATVARVWLAAACLLPYLVWVAFASYVTYLLEKLNP